MVGLSSGLSQELCLEHRLETKIEIEKDITETARDLRAEGLKAVLESIVNTLDPKQPHTIKLTAFLRDPDFQESLLKHVDAIIKPGFDPKELAISFLYTVACEKKGGKFEVDSRQIAGSKEYIAVDFDSFKKAVLTPEKLEQEIQQDNSIIIDFPKKGVDNNVVDSIIGLSHEQQKKHDALYVAEKYKPIVQNFLTLFSQLLNCNDKLLYNFLHDTYILNKLDSYVSTQLNKRFCDKLKGIKSSGNIKETFKTIVLNTTAEFVLISLGIISPKIFCLQEGEISPKKTKAFEAFCQELNIDPDALANHYNVQKSGVFFWHRYAVQGRNPTKDTEQKIREFITKSFRESSAEILTAMQFEDVFKNINQQLKKLGQKPNKTELKSVIEVFVQMLKKKEFQTLVIEKLKSPEWQQALAGLVV